MAIDEDNDDGLGGRSRTRREVTASHRYAKQLAELDDVQLAELTLPDIVRDEIVNCRKIPKQPARGRQLDYIDKLVRALEEPEQLAIAAFLTDPHRATQRHQSKLDRWFERLLSGGDDVVDALLAVRPELPVQRLRQFIRNARKERERGRGTKAARDLREMLAEG